MLSNKSLLVLLLAAYASTSHAALRRRHKDNEGVKRQVAGKAEHKELLKEDTGFWNRFAQEVVSSVPICCEADACDASVQDCSLGAEVCDFDGACCLVCDTLAPTPVPCCEADDCDPATQDCSLGAQVCDEDTGACCSICETVAPTPPPESPCCEAGECDPTAQDCSLGAEVCDDNGDCCLVCDTPAPSPAPTPTPEVPCCEADDCDPATQDCSLNAEVCDENGDCCVVCDTPAPTAAPTPTPETPCCEADECDPSTQDCSLGAEVCDDNGDCCLVCDTPAPTPAPPPDTCSFDLNIECPDCTPNNTAVEPCFGRPLEMTFLYAGGGCDKSNQCQPEDKYTCTDFNGGPPTNPGERAWILVMDDGLETTFFEGWVGVYETFLLTNNLERFPADQNVRVWSDESKTDDVLLQDLTYHSSCSQNLDLCNRFGSQVIYGWFNEEQGNITCAVNSTFAVEAVIPLTANFNDGAATVTGLTIASTAEATDTGVESFDPQFYNLTDSVAGQTLNAGDSLEVAFNVPLNGAFEMDYSFLITMSLETASGDDCTGSSLFTFTAGGLPELEFGNENCEAFLAVYEAGQDGGGGGGGNKDKNNDKDKDKDDEDEDADDKDKDDEDEDADDKDEDEDEDDTDKNNKDKDD